MKQDRFVYIKEKYNGKHIVEERYHLRLDADGYVVAVPVEEKKCTCGDTETQHYENTDKCVVCGCKEFEEVDEKYEMPQFEGTYEALEKILPTKVAQNIAEAIISGKQKSI
jgi:hypothetical protein